MGNVDQPRDGDVKWATHSIDKKAAAWTPSEPSEMSPDEQELHDAEDAGLIRTQEMRGDKMVDIDFANADD
jgi:hypothetical protein